MSIPLSTGSDPETTTISKDQWVLTFSSVNVGIIKNTDPDSQVVYMTYKVTGNEAPTDLTSQPIWRVNTPALRVGDGYTLRDIYVWADGVDAILDLEA